MARIETLPQPLPFGKYELLERIASGRMGEIFKARKGGVEGFEKILVVKRLFPHLSSSQPFVSAFIDEAKRTVSLSHANIVQVLDLGQQGEAYFMAEEYVPGYDLGTCDMILQSQGRPFPMDIAVFTVSEVAKGLDYAHRRKDYNFESLNIVHRDLSPHNILISFEGEVKISDFGITRALEAAGTANSDLRRRYLYASPEQARGETLTASSDIFALGLCLYGLLTGRHPYDHPDPRVVAQNAQNAHITPIQDIANLPRALVQIVNSTLAVDPDSRVDSAGTLYEELISYLFASGQKADNRSLSLFMQDLRISEEQVFPHGNRPLVPGSAPPPVAAPPAPAPFVAPSAPFGGGSAGDLEELDVEDLEEVDADMMEDEGAEDEDEPAWGAQQPAWDAPQPAWNGAAAHAAEPAWEPQAPPAQQALRFDAPVGPEALEHWLDALAAQLSAGQGAAFAMVGEIGAAWHHIADRLPELLHPRGVRPITLTASSAHRSAPLTLLARLVWRAANMPDWSMLHGDLVQQRTRALDEQGMAQLEGLGLDPSEQTLAGHACGLIDALDVGAHTRVALGGELARRLAVTLAGDAPTALIVDGLPSLDPASRALLPALLAAAAEAPLAIVLVDPDEALLEALAGADGEPLPALTLEGRPSQLDEEAVLRGASEEALAALTALAVAGQALPMHVVAALAGLDEGQLRAAVDELQSKQALRAAEQLSLATPTLLSILTDELVVGALPRAHSVAIAIGDAAARVSLPDAPLSPRWTALHTRRLAWLHQRDAALRTALTHARWLTDNGWRSCGMAAIEDAVTIFAQTEAGSPHAFARLAALHARLALLGLDVEAARSSLDALHRVTAGANDLHGLLDAHLLAGRVALCDDAPCEAWAWFADVLRAADQAALPDVLIRARLAAARWHVEHGSLREAYQCALAASSLMDRFSLRAHHPRLAAQALALLADVAAQRGQLWLASNHLVDLQALSHLLPSAFAILLTEYVQCAIHVRSFGGGEATARAEELAMTAADHDLGELQARFLRLVAEAAIQVGDVERASRAASALVELGVAHNHVTLARIGRDFASLVAVMTSTGDRALDALQVLQQGLTRAVEQATAGDQFQAHLQLFRALNHLGSGADAEHHREEALRFGHRVGAQHLIQQLEAI